MSLYYSDGSSKKGSNSLYASFSAAKNPISGLYYSNGSSKLPVWSSGGKYYIIAYSSDNNYSYKIDINTGQATLIATEVISPAQTFKNRIIQTGTQYQTVKEFDNNGTLVGEYSIGSPRVNINNGLPYSPTSDYIFTVKHESNSIGKYVYYSYKYSTKTLNASATIFSAVAIFDDNNVAQVSDGSSSRLNEYIYNASSMTNIFAMITNQNRSNNRSLPFNLGFVVLANGQATSSSSFEIYRKSGSSWERFFGSFNSTQRNPTYTIMEDHILYQYMYWDGSSSYNTACYARLNYSTWTWDYRNVTKPDNYTIGNGIAISKDRYVVVNGTTKTIEIYQSNPTNVVLISSVPIPSNIKYAPNPYSSLSDGGYLLVTNKYGGTSPFIDESGELIEESFTTIPT